MIFAVYNIDLVCCIDVLHVEDEMKDSKYIQLNSIKQDDDITC